MAPQQVCALFSSSNPFKRAAAVDVDDDQPAPMPKRPKPAPEVTEEEEEEEERGSDECDDEQLEDEDEADAISREQDRYDSDEKLQRTVFVGNLPLDTKKKVLIRTLSCFGSIESARLRSVPVGTTKMPRRGAVITGNLSSNRSSLNAYVVFKHADSARAALTYNMSEFGGKHIRVDLAGARSQVSKGAVSYDKARSIFVGNLPLDVEDEELYALFSVPGVELEAVRVVRDQKTNIGKGFAFVLLKSKDDVKHTFGRGALELRDRKLRLRRVTNHNGNVKQETTKPRRRYKPATDSKVKSRSYEGSRSGQKRRALPQRLTATGRDAKEGDATKKKRPAVIARKAKEKGLQVPTSSKENKPGKKI